MYLDVANERQDYPVSRSETLPEGQDEQRQPGKGQENYDAAVNQLQRGAGKISAQKYLEQRPAEHEREIFVARGRGRRSWLCVRRDRIGDHTVSPVLSRPTNYLNYKRAM